VSGPWADGLAIGVLAPVAAVVSIAGCIVLRRDTREDFLRVVERVRRRRK